MSLMSLGIKMNALKKGIREGGLTAKEQVKEAALKRDVHISAGYENLSAEEKELWYDQLATNLFVHQKNWIPCFMDIGFGKELLVHSSRFVDCSVPEKHHWKIVVTRGKFSDWQFNAIVRTYCREEAVLIAKKFFEDFGDLGFKYDEPTPKTEHKVPWVEINAKKTGTYQEWKLKCSK